MSKLRKHLCGLALVSETATSQIVGFGERGKAPRQKREMFVRLQFLHEASIGLELGRHHILNRRWPA